MTTAAAQARHHTLMRLEQAAGQAFGCADEPETRNRTRQSAALTSAALTVAMVATALAATLTYFV